MNPQISYGEDVMARIAYALEGRRAGRQLRQASSSPGSPTWPRRSVRTAGVLAERDLRGRRRRQHRHAPPLPRPAGAPVGQRALPRRHQRRARRQGARHRLAPSPPGAYVHLLPNIAGFVGADHVAMILATGLYQADATRPSPWTSAPTPRSPSSTTAGSISCSTASGPAFEGAHIRYGMRAIAGAIERVCRRTTAACATRRSTTAPAIGICGSGILDAVAQLYRAGMLDMKGGMAWTTPRVRETEQRPRVRARAGRPSPASARTSSSPAATSARSSWPRAPCAPASTCCCRKLGITAQDIQRFIVAGAFGSYIDVQSAIDIAMFPDLPLERFEQVGNAAGPGARMALLSPRGAGPCRRDRHGWRTTSS